MDVDARKELSLAEIAGSRIEGDILDYCLSLTRRWEDTEMALAGTSTGQIIASPLAWQQALLEIMNVRQLLQQQGVEELHEAVAAANTIRTLLHDADGRRQQGTVLTDAVITRTDAQQALEDVVVEALKLNASDIHLLFSPDHATLNFRVDGRLVSKLRRSRESLAAAIAAALNTHSDDFHEVFDERRLSSASISLTVPLADGPTKIRLRTQKSPTRDGFAVTMRIQRERQQLTSLSDLGVPPATVAAIRLLVERPVGLFVVVGPTGHGKTTTLAGLNLCIAPDQKVISLEEPIEIIQPQIEQKPVIADHPEMNFSNLVKVALREDPDVISISEIRDTETAKAAFTASLTGHLVTATLHAFDTFGALQRLQDLGLSLNSLAQPDVLRGVLAQRLVPAICPACQPKMPCSQCLGTGELGRILVTEFLPMSEELQEAMETGQLTTCRRLLERQGWLSLAASIDQLIHAGRVAAKYSFSGRHRVSQNPPLMVAER